MAQITQLTPSEGWSPRPAPQPRGRLRRGAGRQLTRLLCWAEGWGVSSTCSRTAEGDRRVRGIGTERPALGARPPFYLALGKGEGAHAPRPPPAVGSRPGDPPPVTLNLPGSLPPLLQRGYRPPPDPADRLESPPLPSRPPAAIWPPRPSQTLASWSLHQLCSCLPSSLPPPPCTSCSRSLPQSPPHCSAPLQSGPPMARLPDPSLLLQPQPLPAAAPRDPLGPSLLSSRSVSGSVALRPSHALTGAHRADLVFDPPPRLGTCRLASSVPRDPFPVPR